MINSIEDDSLRNQLSDYHIFLDTLVYLNESLRIGKEPIKYWQKYSESLLLKITFHGFTIHRIYSGIILKSSYYPKELNNKVIVDHASARTVLRSQLESYLMFIHIYLNPKSEEEKELRYLSWILAGLYQRQKFPSKTSFAKNKIALEKTEIEEIKYKIENMNSFRDLTDKQKKELLTNGSTKFFSHWIKIFKESGYDENHILYISYKYWSAYSHSEGISAIQLHDLNLKYDDKDIGAISDIVISKLLICNMIILVKNLYKTARDSYMSLPINLRSKIEYNAKLLKNFTM